MLTGAEEIVFAENRSYPKGVYTFGPYVLAGGEHEIIIDRADWKDEHAALRVDVFALEEDGVTWGFRGAMLAFGGPNRVMNDHRDGLPYTLVTEGRFEAREGAQIQIELNVLNRPIKFHGVLK